MSAVVGIVVANPELNPGVIAAQVLPALGHRGPHASAVGMHTGPDGFDAYRYSGKPSDAFTAEEVAKFADVNPVAAIGHVLKERAPGDRLNETMMRVGQVAVVINGSITDPSRIEHHLPDNASADIRGNSHLVVAHALGALLTEGWDLPTSMAKLQPDLKGFFTIVAMDTAKEDPVVVGLTDHESRIPLSVGIDNSGVRAIATESCALDAIGISDYRELEPDEMVILTKHGVESRRLADGTRRREAAEVLYFANEKSKFFGTEVRSIRWALGEQLAIEHPLPTHITAVMSVPETADVYAGSFAKKNGKEFLRGITKSPGAGRSSAAVTLGERATAREKKYEFHHDLIVGQHLAVVDDTFLTGETAKWLIEKLRTMGALSVSFYIASPPMTREDSTGIDSTTQKDLISSRMSPEEIQAYLQCDYLGFLSAEGLVTAIERATGRPFEYALDSFEPAAHPARRISVAPRRVPISA